MIEWYKSMVPRACFYIDCNIQSTLEGFEVLAYGSENSHQRKLAEEDLQRLWKNEDQQFSILPCLSVRSGLDLYLSAKSFPKGSEIILSAINIPALVHIIHHHGLIIRSCDLLLDTMAPSLQRMKTLINKKTVAVLVAHLYGKRFNMNPIIELCKSHGLPVLEDCAEVFCGLKFFGHPESDVTFFSFGSIKYATAFGGAIVRMNERKLYERMKALQDKYPLQTYRQYATILSKYAMLSVCFNNTVVFKLLSFTELDYKLSQDKGAYVMEGLPPEAGVIGKKSLHVGHWLFPIVVEHPELLTAQLNQLGIDASLNTTQLKLVEDDVTKKEGDELSTPRANLLMKQVVYIPVHKMVTYEELDRVIAAVKSSLRDLGCRVVKFSDEK